MQAFIIASTASEEDMLRWYNERVVWNDKQLNLKLLRKGVLTRIYAPMAIVQGLRESGVFTSVIRAAVDNAKVRLKESVDRNSTDPDHEDEPRAFVAANARKILNVVEPAPAYRDGGASAAVPPMSPPGLDEARGEGLAGC
ncbi:unnamed protein product [Triticum turgidum subsp. durum]|uniref:Uncharacterized protein n=1 Tax=Triticum turgidum subsp. durum TaxID=4567 RepID=A0A9R0QLP4_TRITD|nr:unnamed protein product [Triticum turgidum subsp. durum]